MSNPFRGCAGAAALATTLVVCACSAPPDRDPIRPSAELSTPLPQRHLRLGGLRIRYVDVESESANRTAPPLILVTGHTSRVEEYDALIPALSQRRRVLVLDFPGSGYSSKPEREYTLAFYEETLLAFLDALGVTRADIAGGSLGGNLTLRLAWRAPDRFRRAVAWAPGSAWDAHPSVASAMRALPGRMLFWPTVWLQSRFWYSRDWPQREAALATTFAYCQEVMSPGFLRMYWGIAADQVGSSLFDIAPEIRLPVLLAWGDRDNGANMGAGVAKLARLIPGAELRVFPGARHSLASEVPAELAAEIDAFLSRDDLGPLTPLPRSH